MTPPPGDPGPRPASAGGTDPERERRLARRRLARELHPDRGGDPAVYLAALAELDARYAVPGGAGTSAAPGPAATPAAGAGDIVLVRSGRWAWPGRLRRRLRDHRRRGWAQL